MANRATRRGNRSSRTLVSGLALAAVLTATRPAIPAKVYAASNAYEWVKHVDHDLLGGDYTSAASSADGSHLILGTAWGGEFSPDYMPLYASDDYGATWENVAEAADEGIRNHWTSVDITNDGQTIVAASEWGDIINTYDDTEGKILISEDGGDTWTDISPEDTAAWQKIAIAGDGSRIVALSYDDEDNVYISNDGGDNWQTSPVEDVWEWESLSISDDGSKILVGGENSETASSLVYFSQNGGTTWVDISPDDGHMVDATRTAISASGNKIVVSAQAWSDYDAVYISENYGASWTDITPDDANFNEWEALAISGNGKVLSVLDDDDKMYISSDDGATWTEEDPGHEDDDSNGWRSIDFNASGSRIIVASWAHAYTGYNANLNKTAAVNFTDAESGKPIRLITPDGTTITCYSSVKESVLTAQDAGYHYPVGLVDFCFSTEDESNEISLLFVTDLKPNQVVARKYNPTTQQYASVSGVSITETTHNGQHALLVTYTIVDNGPLDLDPDDGEIADPIGLGTVLGAPSTGLQNIRDFLFRK